MNKTYFRYFAGVLALLSIWSCENESASQLNYLDKWIENGHITVSASSSEPNTKTVLHSGGAVYWSPQDSISVFFGPYNLGKFVGLNTEPVDVTVFRSEETFAFGTIGGGSGCQFWGINPFDSANKSDGNSVTLTIPSEQNAVAGTFAPGSFPSIAKSDDLEFSFYNVCGGLKFKVTNPGITKVCFKGNNGETVAGRVKVDFDGDNLPHILEYKDTDTQVCLNCPEGLIPGEWYFISILPVALTQGFTIELSDGVRQVSYVSEKNTTVKRSIFGVLSDIDDGLSFEYDWKKCDFVHKSLLLAIPNCAFSSIVIAEESGLISQSRTQTGGNMEVMQMFANGPSPSNGVQSMISLFGITTVPFEITDYREKVDGAGTTPFTTYKSTPQIYGTASGLGINSFYNGDELNVEVSLYFKKADEYKIIVALVQDDSSYKISTNGGSNQGNITSDGIMRYVLTDMNGDPVSVLSEDIVSYRSYKKVISNAEHKENLRVLVYILRPYGSREVVSNGSFGSYYVDNSFSVPAGHQAQLPVIKKINSEIADFDYGGIIEL